MASLVSFPAVAPPDMILHASVTQGERNIAAVWLTTATDHYNQGVLGDKIKATAVAAHLQNGDVLQYDLPTDSVFENLTSRPYGIDGEGVMEFAAVVTPHPRGVLSFTNTKENV